MKKIIALSCLIIAMTTLLTACGKFTCAACEKEKTGKKHRILGNDIVMCDDCHNELYDEVVDAVNDLL